MRENEVIAWRVVAARSPASIGASIEPSFFMSTSSMRYFVDAGRTMPLTRFARMSRSPRTNSFRRGQMISRKALLRLLELTRLVDFFMNTRILIHGEPARGHSSVIQSRLGRRCFQYCSGLARMSRVIW